MQFAVIGEVAGGFGRSEFRVEDSGESGFGLGEDLCAVGDDEDGGTSAQLSAELAGIEGGEDDGAKDEDDEEEENA